MVMFEEAQRYLLDLFLQLAIELFKESLTILGADLNAWENARPQRMSFVSLLNAFPDEAFKITNENIIYWLNFIQGAVDMVIALGGQQSVNCDWVRTLTIIYSAIQLLFVGLQRVNSGSARADFLNLYAVETPAPPFLGAKQGADPPSLITNHLYSCLGLPVGTQINLEHLAEYLTQDVLLQLLVEKFPVAQPFLEILAGPLSIERTAAAKIILKNLGAFIPDTIDPTKFDPVEFYEFFDRV